jgi:hypothetical protein
MNMLADFAAFMELGMTRKVCMMLTADEKKGLMLWRRWKNSDDKFAWYLSLTMEQSDRLYLYLLRWAGEQRKLRKMHSDAQKKVS